MRAIKFKQANTSYPTVIKRHGGKEIKIPAFRFEGLVTTVFKGNIIERIKFLITGKIYHTQACPNQPMQAVAMNFDSPFVKKKVKQSNLKKT